MFLKLKGNELKNRGAPENKTTARKIQFDPG